MVTDLTTEDEVVWFGYPPPQSAGSNDWFALMKSLLISPRENSVRVRDHMSLYPTQKCIILCWENVVVHGVLLNHQGVIFCEEAGGTAP